MTPSWKVGRIAGVEIGLHWTVLLIVALVTWSLGAGVLPDRSPGYSTATYWMAGAIVAVAFGGSILAHELSHAVVARRQGVPVESIVLWMFGGVAKLESQARTARGELQIALAGPAMSIVIGAGSLGLAALLHVADASDLATSSLAWLGGINLVLAIFNLLPGAPLDGGRVLAAVLWWRSGNERQSRRRAAGAGRILGQILIAVGIVEFALVGGAGLWTALVGWLIMSMAHMELVDNDLRELIAGVTVGDVMTRNVVTVHDDLTVEEFLHGPWMAAHVSTFPVLDQMGRPTGLITLKHLSGLPSERWASTRLTAVATPIDRVTVAAPEAPLAEVMRTEQGARTRVLVVSAGRLVGIVSPSDVSSAIERLALLRGVALDH